MLADHNFCVKYLSKFLDWTDGGVEDVPVLNDYHYGIDRESVQQDLLVWKEINRLFEERGYSFPRIKHIISLLAAIHNKLKIGVDGNSRLHANAHARHGKLKPMGQFLLRTISDTFLNTFQLKSLFDTLEWLLDETGAGPATFLEYKTRRNNQCGSFSDFCLKMARSNMQYSPTQFGVVVRPPAPVVAPTPLPSSGSRVSKAKYKLAMNSNAPESDVYKLRTTFNAKLTHEALPLEKQSASCQLCCRSHGGKELGAHSRVGYQPKHMCATCRVVLCQTRRWDADIKYVDSLWKANPARDSLKFTCHDVWHQAKALPNLSPCCKAAGWEEPQR